MQDGIIPCRIASYDKPEPNASLQAPLAIPAVSEIPEKILVEPRWD